MSETPSQQILEVMAVLFLGYSGAVATKVVYNQLKEEGKER